MGTNYYLKRNCCPTCGRGDEPLHIGKSSGGWCFSLHVHPEDGINDLCDWEKEMYESGGVIENEYGETISVVRMLEIITERSSDRDWNRDWVYIGYNSENEFHQRNHSMRGPNYLLRHQLSHGCIGHGNGTYDYITGDFS